MMQRSNFILKSDHLIFQVETHKRILPGKTSHPSQACLENSLKAHFCALSHCPLCLPKAKPNFPVWPLFCMWCHFSSALQRAMVFGLFRLGSAFTSTTTMCREHCLKASGTLSAPQHKGQTSHPSTTCWAGTSGRTSSPKIRSWAMTLSMHPHQRMGSSASLGGPQEKPHGYWCFWFGGPWARALPLSRTQQHCRNLIQRWAEQHPRVAPQRKKPQWANS